MRRNQHYQDRVNRVLDYIAEHLAGDLSLTRLAALSCFSPFHFHRIFQSVTGETVNTHVRRVRLERAARLMGASPQKRITDVALEVGFAGTAEFSRAFKNHFGLTASSWDRRSPLKNSKIGKAPESLPFHTVEELRRWKAQFPAIRVRIARRPAFRFVYSRLFQSYGNQQLVEDYNALTAWLADRGTRTADIQFIGMSQDDPTITPASHCRYDLGVAFTGDYPTPTECSQRGFTIRDFPPHHFATLHGAGDITHIGFLWQYLYCVWLPNAASEPADLPAMEVFVKLPHEIGWETFDLHACIPIRK